MDSACAHHEDVPTKGKKGLSLEVSIEYIFYLNISVTVVKYFHDLPLKANSEVKLQSLKLCHAFFSLYSIVPFFNRP